MSVHYGPRQVAGLVFAAANAVGRAKLRLTGPFFYALIWLSYPIFNLFMVALIYRHDSGLRDYAIIGGAGMAMLFTMQFNGAEILDGERQRGTLGNLFLAPAPRYAWLGGFQLFAVVESLICATITLVGGILAFGLHVDVNVPALLLAIVLFILCLWGFSMITGAIGVAIRDANQLSNLIFTPLMLVAGTMYPISLLPDWLRIPARCLPFGYAMQALADATSRDASVSQLCHQLLPLAGFAAVLPVLGVYAFGRVVRLTRDRGTLDLV